MRPKDIVVGQYYRHEDHPGAVFVGTAIMGNKFKFLLIIKGEGKNHLVFPPERYVMANQSKKGLYKWWSKLSPIK